MKKVIGLLIGFLITAMLALAPGEASARYWVNFPNSGYCNGSLKRVKNLRACHRFTIGQKTTVLAR